MNEEEFIELSHEYICGIKDRSDALEAFYEDPKYTSVKIALKAGLIIGVTCMDQVMHEALEGNKTAVKRLLLDLVNNATNDNDNTQQ